MMAVNDGDDLQHADKRERGTKDVLHISLDQ
jgi:hypothetical protein